MNDLRHLTAAHAAHSQLVHDVFFLVTPLLAFHAGRGRIVNNVALYEQK